MCIRDRDRSDVLCVPSSYAASCSSQQRCPMASPLSLLNHSTRQGAARSSSMNNIEEYCVVVGRRWATGLPLMINGAKRIQWPLYHARVPANSKSRDVLQWAAPHSWERGNIKLLYQCICQVQACSIVVAVPFPSVRKVSLGSLVSAAGILSRTILQHVARV